MAFSVITLARLCVRCEQPRGRYRLCDGCRRDDVLAQPDRWCSKCQTRKPHEDFSASINPQSWCRACSAESNRRKRKSDPERTRAWDSSARVRNQSDPTYSRRRYSYMIKTKYGLEREEFDAMVLAHEGRCALCLVATPDLIVDHCHQTGRVRGLLCSRCNTGLGLLGDNDTAIANALAYLLSTNGVLTDHLG